MVGRGEKNCVVIVEISASRAPVYVELPLLSLVLDPVVMHVN